MAFARPYSKKEQEYIIQWQHEKSPGMIAKDLNQWPENKDDPRHIWGIRKFLFRRKRQMVPGEEDVPIS